MAIFTRFCVVFVLTMLVPHVEGGLRLPFMCVYAYALYELLYRGIWRV